MNPNEVTLLAFFATTTVNNNTVNVPVVDTLVNNVQFQQVDFFLYLGPTDIALTALKVQEADTTGGAFADIAAAVFGAMGKPALPSATDDNKLYHISVSNRKRALKLLVTVGSGSVGAAITVMAFGSRPKLADIGTALPSARNMTNQEIVA